MAEYADGIEGDYQRLKDENAQVRKTCNEQATEITKLHQTVNMLESKLRQVAGERTMANRALYKLILNNLNEEED
jgi:archaellum component FlaC